MRDLTDQEPRNVGPYRITAYIGGGGMGQVYLGRSPGGYAVAVKVIRPELAEDDDFRDRFAAEVEAARRVSGVYTAAVVDADVRAEAPWMATEYVPGSPLDDVVRDLADQEPEQSRGLPPHDVLVLAAGLAEALQAIHRTGLVHRDLKPGNVILAENGPKVLDFGIAKALEAGAHTTTQTVIGTPAFMAPEQVLGKAVPASDVFSLGATLAYAATGRILVAPGLPAAVGAQIVAYQLDLTVLDGLPGALRTLIVDCLAKSAQDRPTPTQILERAAELVSSGRAWDAGLTEVIRETTTVPTEPVRPTAPTRRLTPAPVDVVVPDPVASAVPEPVVFAGELGGATVPAERPGRSLGPFWAATAGAGVVSGFVVFAGVMGFTEATSGAADWLLGLQRSAVVAPAVGLISGLAAQRRAHSSWRRSPWTAIRLDASSLTVMGHDQPSRKTYSIAWNLIEQVGISDNGVGSWVVVRFVAGTFPTNAEARTWADQRGAQQRLPDDPNTFNLCQPAQGADEAEAERLVAQAREAISAYAGPRFIDLDRVGRPRHPG
jgi:serine/threonine protein kinase